MAGCCLSCCDPPAGLLRFSCSTGLLALRPRLTSCRARWLLCQVPLLLSWLLLPALPFFPHSGAWLAGCPWQLDLYQVICFCLHSGPRQGAHGPQLPLVLLRGVSMVRACQLLQAGHSLLQGPGRRPAPQGGHSLGGRQGDLPPLAPVQQREARLRQRRGPRLAC